MNGHLKKNQHHQRRTKINFTKNKNTNPEGLEITQRTTTIRNLKKDNFNCPYKDLFLYI